MKEKVNPTLLIRQEIFFQYCIAVQYPSHRKIFCHIFRRQRSWSNAILSHASVCPRILGNLEAAKETDLHLGVLEITRHLCLDCKICSTFFIMLLERMVKSMDWIIIVCHFNYNQLLCTFNGIKTALLLSGTFSEWHSRLGDPFS